MANDSSTASRDAVKLRDDFPYRLREPFLSTPEAALFRTLKQMTGERYVIYAKVSLNDLFYIIRPNENVHSSIRFSANTWIFYCVIQKRSSLRSAWNWSSPSAAMKPGLVTSLWMTCSWLPACPLCIFLPAIVTMFRM